MCLFSLQLGKLHFPSSLMQNRSGLWNNSIGEAIEANDLKNPPSGARNLWSVIDSNVSSLFADGEKPFRSAHECNASNCSTNCPDSERDAVISRRRRALLCLKGPTTLRRLQFTCSVPCPAWQPAAPRIVWLQMRTGIAHASDKQEFVPRSSAYTEIHTLQSSEILLSYCQYHVTIVCCSPLFLHYFRRYCYVIYVI